ncbi:MAG: radical SAM protein [Finegoldia magna]|uniref:Radical SAM protein n=1 Tax=Finegoldia magna TaxID=1260 RepID=A0A943L8K6_FINMA|nr:radical SAM protein [Finegoldia magna]MBS5965557.1 radical SAM protein [Finegoldia magna]
MYFKELEIYQSNHIKNLVFSCKDLNFYLLNDEYVCELDNYKNSDNINSSIIEKLRSIKSKDEESKIDSLKLIMANSCNMNCKYCYAEGGNYGRKNGLMKKEVAYKVVEFVNRNGIKNVCFFGGEPLLAFESIKFICSHLKDKVNYLIQTNGTILNDEIIELLKKYKFSVTVSIDGNKEINDKNRIFVNGKGTYDVIAENIDKMLDNGINISVLEGTITKNTNRIESFSNIEKFLKNRFKGPLVQLEKDLNYNDIYDDREKEYYGSLDEIVKKFDKRIINNLGDYKDPIDHIISQKYQSYFCGAGSEQFTVDINGDVYICPMFMNKHNSNKTNFNICRDQFVDLTEYTKKYKKSNIKKCEKCVAKFNCSRCIAVDNEVIENRCTERRINTEKAIEYLMDLILNDQYNNFVKTYSKLSGRFI